MNLNFTSDMSGWSEWGRKAAERAKNLEPVHEVIGDLMVAEMRDNFQTGGGTEKWEPLKPSTLTPKRLTYGTRPLLKTLDLFNKLTKNVTGGYVDVGSALIKARTLFFGHGPVPARSPFNWRAGVLERVNQMYAKYIFLGGL